MHDQTIDGLMSNQGHASQPQGFFKATKCNREVCVIDVTDWKQV